MTGALAAGVLAAGVLAAGALVTRALAGSRAGVGPRRRGMG
jgi:hypothetical protein